MAALGDVVPEDLGPKAGATALLVFTAATGLHLWSRSTIWCDGFARLTSLGLCVAVVATMLAVFRGPPFARRCLAASLLLAVDVVLVALLLGYELHAPTRSDPRWAAILLVVTTAAAVGVLARRRWARWLALGLAFAGASMAFNHLGSLIIEPDFPDWLCCAVVVGGGLVLVDLAGAKMAASDLPDAFASSRSFPDRECLWWWLRGAVLPAFVVAPMLVFYAWGELGTIPSFETPAVLLAIALWISAAFVLRGRAIGGPVLAASGVVLVAFVLLLLVGTTELAYEHGVATGYVVIMLPVGVIATASGLGLARAAWRLTDESGP